MPMFSAYIVMALCILAFSILPFPNELWRGWQAGRASRP